MRLINEIFKNLLLIFRNWASLSLLVLGPLVLIVIIGLTFSGDTAQGLSIGVDAENRETVQDFLGELEGIDDLRTYADLDACVTDIATKTVHLCITAETSNESGFPHASLAFYYDDADKKLSNLLVTRIDSLITKSSRNITFASTKNILEQIQTMTIFLDARRGEIEQVRNESLSLRATLVERGEKLEEVYADFKPRYDTVKRVQENISVQTGKANASLQLSREELGQARASIKLLRGYLAVGRKESAQDIDALLLDIQNYTFTQAGNATLAVLTYTNTTTPIDLTALAVDDRLDLVLGLLEQSLDRAERATDESDAAFSALAQDIGAVNATLSSVIYELDTIDFLLREEIRFNNESIHKIDIGVSRIEEVSDELDAGIDQLILLNPGLAEQIANPILRAYYPTKTFTNVMAIFPALLVMILAFITLLFANTMLLSELHSDAYFRGIISPVPRFLVPLGVILTNLILVTFQISVLFIIAQFKFQIDVFSQLPILYLLTTILILFFSAIGMIIAFLIKNEQTSVLTTTFVALAFYLFSNIISPLELMPATVAKVVSFNPVVVAEQVFRGLLLYGVTPAQSAILFLVAVMVGALIILFFANKRQVAAQ